MSRDRSNSTLKLNQGIQKFSLSVFVVVAFIAYTIHDRLTNSNGGLNSAQAAPGTVAGQDTSGSPVNPSFFNSAANAPAPNSQSQSTASNSGSSKSVAYKDGTYTGPEIDVNYGLVKVQATVQSGRLTDVKIVEYPTDRRTSQRINSIAVPYLQQEAIQAQSANVNLISGATLTSEGFAMSLDAALATAH
jgi:uncharacterized protein with FMN-binding domain